MKKSITIGLEIRNTKGEVGKITKIITPSTGYAEVTFNGVSKKVMLKVMGYTTLDGVEVFKGNAEKIAAAKHAKISEKLVITANTPASWMNADGTKNWDKYNAFLEEREAAKWASKSF